MNCNPDSDVPLWFFRGHGSIGVQQEAEGEILEVNSATISSTGSYYCITKDKTGKKFLSEAFLKVYG